MGLTFRNWNQFLGKMMNIKTRGRHSYNTKSNKQKAVRTPGGKYVYHALGKRAKHKRCGDTNEKLNGVVAARPALLRRLTKSWKTVDRAYGGCLSGKAVKSRILRSFLAEEQQIVSKVLRSKKVAKAAPVVKKAPAKSSKK